MSDIDDIIKSLENEETLPEKTKKEVKAPESNIPDVSEDEEVIKAVFEMTVEDRKKADNAYEIFAPDVARGQDRSSASKEAMMKAIELKINSVKNIIDVMKLKQKKDNPSVGVFIDTQSQKKAGIDLRNIASEMEDE